MSFGPEKERSINPDFEFVRDYSALNKAALEAGMTSAKEQSRFRSVSIYIHFDLVFFLYSIHRTVHDIKKKVSIRDVSHSKKTRRFPDDMIFGNANR